MAKKKTDETSDGSEIVTVRVTGQAVAENDAHFTKGETFETTAARAEALGELVSIVDALAETLPAE